MSQIDDRCELWSAASSGPQGKTKNGHEVLVASSAGAVEGETLLFEVGASPDEQGSMDYRTVARRGASGEVVWEATLDLDGRWDVPFDLAVSPDGSTVFVTGEGSYWSDYETLRSFADFATVAYDARTGDVVWVRTYDGPAAGHDRANAVQVSADGRTVIVVGSAQRPQVGLPRELTAVAYDAETGKQRWVAAWGGGQSRDEAWRPESAQAVDAKLDPETGRLYVAGFVITGDPATGGFGRDYTLTALETRDLETGDPDRAGEILWHRTFDRFDGDDAATALAIEPGGERVFITGWSQRPGAGVLRANIDYGTLGYRASDGQLLWTAFYHGPTDGINAGLAIAANQDRVFVTGLSTGDLTDGDPDFGTLAYETTTGEVAWVRRYGIPNYSTPNFENEWGASVVVAPDGRTVFVTGPSTHHLYGHHRHFGPGPLTNPGVDYATLAYDALDGTKRWVARYNSMREPTLSGQDHGVPASMALSPSGDRLFVSGTVQYFDRAVEYELSGSSDVYAWETVAYDV